MCACVCQRGAHLYLSYILLLVCCLCTMVSCLLPSIPLTHTHTHTLVAPRLPCQQPTFEARALGRAYSRCWGNPGSARPLLSGTHTCSLPIHALIIICIHHEYITSTPCAGDVCKSSVSPRAVLRAGFSNVMAWTDWSVQMWTAGVVWMHHNLFYFCNESGYLIPKTNLREAVHL